MSGLYDNAPKEVLEARPYGIKFASEIVSLSNSIFKIKAGAMAGLIAALTLQNIITSITISLHPPGSKEGEAFIKLLYENAIRDAIERWHKPDLKHFYSKKGKS